MYYNLYRIISCLWFTYHTTVLLYFISPIPLAIARCFKSQEVISAESLSVLFDVCYFLSACIVVSGFGLPFVLSRQGVVSMHIMQWRYVVGFLRTSTVIMSITVVLYWWSGSRFTHTHTHTDPTSSRRSNRSSKYLCFWNCVLIFCFLWSRRWMGLEQFKFLNLIVHVHMCLLLYVL